MPVFWPWVFLIPKLVLCLLSVMGDNFPWISTTLGIKSKTPLWPIRPGWLYPPTLSGHAPFSPNHTLVQEIPQGSMVLPTSGTLHVLRTFTSSLFTLSNSSWSFGFFLVEPPAWCCTVSTTTLPTVVLGEGWPQRNVPNIWEVGMKAQWLYVQKDDAPGALEATCAEADLLIPWNCSPLDTLPCDLLLPLWVLGMGHVQSEW